MSKTPAPSAAYLVTAIAGIAVAVIVAVGLLLREYAPGNMGNGFLQGAAVAAVGAAIMGWRVHRKGARATTFERAFTQTGDERDDDLLTRAFAVMGFASVPLIGTSAIVVSLGAETAMIFALLLLAQILVGGVSFAFFNRRR